MHLCQINQYECKINEEIIFPSQVVCGTPVVAVAGTTLAAELRLSFNYEVLPTSAQLRGTPHLNMRDRLSFNYEVTHYHFLTASQDGWTFPY